jgi:hypothetical protein
LINKNANKIIFCLDRICTIIVYLILGLKTPEPIANIIDTLVGKIVIILIVIYLFMHANPILAVLALFVAFDLIRRSSAATGIDALKKYAPSEEKKISQFTAFNQFPYTLEQEVVAKMAPIMKATLFVCVLAMWLGCAALAMARARWQLVDRERDSAWTGSVLV